ncbi:MULTISPECIES: hypothetical protein [unclassified Rhizobium]|uniref:hypothetical protein n=1 Tax=unclassified Rhizobium TaxID=2613769 RepID=UPI00119FEDBE|nr:MULTISPECIES: hypothetical protein [unclassified Rhizobium]
MLKIPGTLLFHEPDGMRIVADDFSIILEFCSEGPAGLFAGAILRTIGIEVDDQVVGAILPDNREQFSLLRSRRLKNRSKFSANHDRISPSATTNLIGVLWRKRQVQVTRNLTLQLNGLRDFRRKTGAAREI